VSSAVTNSSNTEDKSTSAANNNRSCHPPRPSSKNESYEDVSFSQIDPSFLEALPDDLKAELEEQLRGEKSNKAAATAAASETAFTRLMAKARTSPGNKANSPQAPAAQPQRSKKRGRPSKNSPRFVKSSAKKLKVTSGQPPVRRALFEGDNKDAKENRVLPTTTAAADLPPKTTEKCPELTVEPEVLAAPPKANLEGNRSLGDLRPLYRAWVRSTEQPTEDDTDTVSKFLCDVVRESDLDTVYMSFKSLRRLCSDSNSPDWNRAYNTIVENVQQTMLLVHGKRIYTNF